MKLQGQHKKCKSISNKIDHVNFKSPLNSSPKVTIQYKNVDTPNGSTQIVFDTDEDAQTRRKTPTHKKFNS